MLSHCEVIFDLEEGHSLEKKNLSSLSRWMVDWRVIVFGILWRRSFAGTQSRLSHNYPADPGHKHNKQKLLKTRKWKTDQKLVLDVFKSRIFIFILIIILRTEIDKKYICSN